MKYTDTVKNVLLVDDDTSITFLTKLALKELTDWQVEVADSGPQALAMAETSRPDLILLDAMMPGMDGSETYSRLRAMPALQLTHIIFVTAKVQTSEIAQFLKLGADGVITKPFDPITLVDEIDTVMAQSHQHCEP